LLPKKKTSSGFEFVSGLTDGASAMPAKWSRPVFSFRFYEDKIRRALSVSGDVRTFGCATAQRLHEIDHPPRRGKRLLALWHGAGLFGLQVRAQRLLVAIAEGEGVEIGGLAVDNMPGEREQVRRKGEVQ